MKKAPKTSKVPRASRPGSSLAVRGKDVRGKDVRGKDVRGKDVRGKDVRGKDVRGKDVALLHSLTDDGQGVNIVRVREGRLEFGSVRPLREGRPIHGEVVQLEPRREMPLVCDVKPCHLGAGLGGAADGTQANLAEHAANEKNTPQLKGPAQVATDRYRKNWDLIYRQRKPNLLN